MYEQNIKNLCDTLAKLLYISTMELEILPAPPRSGKPNPEMYCIFGRSLYIDGLIEFYSEFHLYPGALEPDGFKILKEAILATTPIKRIVPNGNKTGFWLLKEV